MCLTFSSHIFSSRPFGFFWQKLACGTSLPGLTAAKLGCKVILADRFCDSRSKELVVKTCRENAFQVKECIWQDEKPSNVSEDEREDAKTTQRVQADGTSAQVNSLQKPSSHNDCTAIYDDDGASEHCAQESTSHSSFTCDSRVIHLMTITWGQFTCDILSIPDASLDYIIASDCFYDMKDFEDICATVHFLLRVKAKQQCTLLVTYEERNSDWSIDCLLHKWKLRASTIPLESFEANDTQLLGSHLPGACTVALFKISLDCDLRSDRAWLSPLVLTYFSFSQISNLYKAR